MHRLRLNMRVSIHRWRQYILAIAPLFVAAVFLSGCQATGQRYSLQTVPNEPVKSSSMSEAEHVARVIAYRVPRHCVFWTSRGPNEVGGKSKVTSFSFSQVISNQSDDGWYVANVLNETSAAQNSLEMFGNARTGAWACGRKHLASAAPGVDFQAAKFFDVSLGKAQTSNSRPSEKRPIAMQWEGYSDLIAGYVDLNQRRDGGTVQASLPNNDGTCSGSYDMTSRTEGTWTLSCTNGMAASGALKAYGSGKGSSGVGQDSKGNTVTYTLGAR